VDAIPHHPRIVIPIVAGIGNAIMTVPMVRQLKRGLPHSHITIVARIPAMGQVFDRLPEVDELRIMRRGAIGYARGMFALHQPRRPDVVIVPFPSNRWQYVMLALASGARRRVMHRYPVGYVRALGLVPADRVPAVRGIHDVVQNLYLLRQLGLEPDINEAPSFPVTEDDRAAAARLFQQAGLDPDCRPIAIHPGSARTVLARAKRWPAASYAQLITRLQDSHAGRIVILEGPDEAGVGDEIARSLPAIRVPILRLTGPLGDTAAVLERSQFCIGSDSGLGHLCAAVGTAPITLFAPADPDRVCPFGYRHLVIQPPGRACPCFLYPWDSPRPKMRCTDDACIRSLPVDLVLEKIAKAAELTVARATSP
jgi:ADP-heptose:LPS heptosyltransferase